MQPVNVERFFYDERHALTIRAATTILSIVSKLFGVPTAVLDVGCGVGTWLFAAQAMGATKVHGIEGTWMTDTQELVVPRDDIEILNLEDEWNLSGHYDLAISLEVAEHISPKAGERLVARLCAASPVVLFSAAAPGQRGNGHINEQWPEYWQKKFAENRYRALDCVRPVIWNREEIPWWYRQNILVFAREDVARNYYLALAATNSTEDAEVLGMLHPAIGSVKIKQSEKPKAGLFRRVIGRVKRSLASSS